ncbi:MAG: hypothetical protein IPF98_02935 [Gemmatimonadetes bacterium]|nr:hypothetical protein [Gemmatimonadota bacterium]MCC6771162.1 hypothetical protein [Gemmatimonadaceae bacterium]
MPISSQELSDAARATAPPSVRERELSGHIFTVSAGLVGVCITVIGLFALLPRPNSVRSIADDLIALDALMFLIACTSAYFALRSSKASAWRRMERLADSVFIVGLIGMVSIGILIAYELI